MIDLFAAIAVVASGLAGPADAPVRPTATRPGAGPGKAGDALSTTAASTCARSSGTSTNSVETRNEKIVARAFDRWAAGGTGFFEQVLSPDVIWTIKGSGPSAGVFRGRRDFLDRAVKPFASRLSRPVRPTVLDIWSKDDRVAVHWDGEATARDGRPYRNSYVWIFRMRGGKAVEATAFLDLVPYDDVLRRIPGN